MTQRGDEKHGSQSPAQRETESAAEERDDSWHQTYTRSDPAQETVALDATYFARLFRDAPAAYIVTDSAMRITDANTAAQKLWNRSLSTFRDRAMWTMVSKEDRQSFQALMPELMTQGMVMTRPLRILPNEGEEVNVFFTACAARGAESGKVDAIFWIFLHPLERWESDLL